MDGWARSSLPVTHLLSDEFYDVLGGRPRPEDAPHANLIERRRVLVWNYAPDHDQYVVHAVFV